MSEVDVNCHISIFNKHTTSLPVDRFRYDPLPRTETVRGGYDNSFAVYVSKAISHTVLTRNFLFHIGRCYIERYQIMMFLVIGRILTGMRNKGVRALTG